MPTNGFYVAPFTFSGELVGRGFWHINELSSKWINISSVFLDLNGEVFNASWGQELSHITTKLTSADGAGLGIFYVNNEIAISTLYLSGSNEIIDAQVMDMFVKSLEDTDIVRKANPAPHPFQDIRNLTDRPMVVTVVWSNPNISEGDNEIIQELSIHFAASYFLKNALQ